MKLLDFHCDTPAALFRSGKSLSDNPFLQVDLRRTAAFRGYCQVAACFCPSTADNETGFETVLRYLAYLKAAVADEPNAVLASDAATLLEAMNAEKNVFLPAVEDLRILNGRLSRIGALRERGVRFATLVWRDTSCIGGAHNTEDGLTPFGQEAVLSLLENGIVPDVSHASQETLRQTAELCRARGKPFVATHSSAFALCPHRRNLTDEELRLIAENGGIIGVNLYPPFLRASGTATVADAVLHIRHLFRIAGKEAVVLGTDLDGVDRLPEGMQDVSDLPRLADAMKKAGFTETEIDRLFYQNGLQFIQNHLN